MAEASRRFHELPPEEREKYMDWDIRQFPLAKLIDEYYKETEGEG